MYTLAIDEINISGLTSILYTRIAQNFDSDVFT